MILKVSANPHRFRGLPLVAGLLLGLAGLQGQTRVDLQTQSKNVDFSNATETKPAKLSAILPATCVPGDVVFLSSAPSGQNLYGCVATNIWALQSGGTGLTVKVSDTLVGTRNAFNVVPGFGFLAVLSDTGSEINAVYAADTSVLLTKTTAQSGSTLLCSSTTGNAAAYGCSMSPTLTSAALTRGAIFAWIPDLSCASGGTTLNIDGLGAKSLKEADGVTNPASANCPAGNMKLIWYDGAVFRLLF